MAGVVPELALRNEQAPYRAQPMTFEQIMALAIAGVYGLAYAHGYYRGKRAARRIIEAAWRDSM